MFNISTDFIYSIIARGSSVFCQMLIMISFSQLYGAKELGIYALVISIATPVIVFCYCDIIQIIHSRKIEKANIVNVISGNILLIVISFLLVTFLFFNNVINYSVGLLYLVIFTLKSSEYLSQTTHAILRVNKQFKLFLILTLVRQGFLVGGILITFFNPLEPYMFFFFILLASILFNLIEIKTIIRSGWTCDVPEFKAILNFYYKYKQLGISGCIKNLGSRFNRYFIFAIYGTVIMGLCAPVFWMLNALATLATSLENVIAPKLTLLIKNHEYNLFLQKSVYYIINLLLLNIIIVLSIYYLGGFYLGLFGLEGLTKDYNKYLNLISLAWLILSLKLICKPVSIATIGVNSQTKIEVFNQVVQIISVVVLTYSFGLYGFFLSYLIGGLISVFAYFILIHRSILTFKKLSDTSQVT